MQMAERTDSKIEARKDDHIEVTALKFNGMIDSLEKFIDKLTKSVEIQAKIQGRKLDRDSKDRHRRSSRDSRDSRHRRDNRDSRTVGIAEEVTGVIQTQVQKMRDKGLEVEIVLEVDLEVEEELSRTVFIATNDLSHCYRYPKDIKKVCSGNLKIDGSGDKDEQARWQMLIDLKNYLESGKDSTN